MRAPRLFQVFFFMFFYDVFGVSFLSCGSCLGVRGLFVGVCCPLFQLLRCKNVLSCVFFRVCGWLFCVIVS